MAHRRPAMWRWAPVLTTLLLLTSSAGTSQSRDERAVRAAYLYNLIRFVNWPASGREITVALAGDSATGDVILPLLDGRTSNGQTIHAVRASAAADLPPCSVLYIADAPEAEVRRDLEQVQGRSALTVGETEAFVRGGGMVALVNTRDRIRIEVNLDATQAAGIHISSRVLDLATIVRSAGKGGH